MTILKSDDKRLCFTICLIVFCLFLTNVSASISDITNIPHSTVSNACKALILVSLFGCLFVFFRRFDGRFLSILLITLSVFLIQIAFFDGNITFFSRTFPNFITTVFPFMICFSVLTDYKSVLSQLKKIAYLISILTAILIVFQGSDAFSGYAMGFSNSMVLPTNVLIIDAIAPYNKKRYIPIIAICFNLFAIAVYGSRGSFIAICLFFLICLFNPYSNLVPTIYKFLIFFALILVVIFFEPIMIFLCDILESLGFKSRTLELLLNDGLHDSGRYEIYDIIWSDFLQSPLKIRGISSDFLIARTYSHNFIIEIFHSLGLLLGLPFCIQVFVQIFKTLKIEYTDYSTLRLLIMFCFFPIVLWSGSIWENMYFWVWLVLCFKKDNKKIPQHTPIRTRFG